MFRELQPLAENVYIFPKDSTPDAIQPNIGVIKLPHETILVDAGNSQRHARQIQAALAGKNFQTIQTIIYTHHHWDHTFAAQAHRPRFVIAHERNHAHMRDFALRDWNSYNLKDEIYRNPRLEISYNAMMDAIPSWQSFRVIQPNITFHTTLTLHYEAFTIELEHVGGRHADDSILVKLPTVGIMFLGDAYYPPPLHLRDEGDEDLAIPMLEKCLAENYHLYVDGHGIARDREQLSEMITWEKRRQKIVNS